MSPDWATTKSLRPSACHSRARRRSVSGSAGPWITATSAPQKLRSVCGILSSKRSVVVVLEHDDRGVAAEVGARLVDDDEEAVVARSSPAHRTTV